MTADTAAVIAKLHDLAERIERRLDLVEETLERFADRITEAESAVGATVAVTSQICTQTAINGAAEANLAKVCLDELDSIVHETESPKVEEAAVAARAAFDRR